MTTTPIDDLPDAYPGYKAGDTSTTRFSINITKEDELTLRAITLNPSYKHLAAKLLIRHLANECRRQKWCYPTGQAKLTDYIRQICGDDFADVAAGPAEGGPALARPVNDERPAVGRVRSPRPKPTNVAAISK